MKIAIVHDMIVARGGAERVLLCFAQAFPATTIFTTCYLPEATYPEFGALDIRSTWYDHIARTETLYKAFYFPVGMLAARSIDLTDYDVILQSTTHGAKYARVRDDALVVSYCYTPFRLLWNPGSYAQGGTSSTVARWLLSPCLAALRRIDRAYAQRPNNFIAMTEATAERIRQSYGRAVSHIISPPVRCDKFHMAERRKDYYLVVSRLEPYKQVALVVRAFNKLGLPLRIAGRGTQEGHLRRLAQDNITFLGRVDDEDLAQLYAECRALIFPQHEDYGLTPLEANASGAPVIAFSRGGIRDTSIPFEAEDRPCTAVLFHEQTEESLMEAVERSRSMTFDAVFIRRHAEKFDVPRFVDSVRLAVSEIQERHIAASGQGALT